VYSTSRRSAVSAPPLEIWCHQGEVTARRASWVCASICWASSSPSSSCSVKAFRAIARLGAAAGLAQPEGRAARGQGHQRAPAGEPGGRRAGGPSRPARPSVRTPEPRPAGSAVVDRVACHGNREKKNAKPAATIAAAIVANRDREHQWPPAPAHQQPARRGGTSTPRGAAAVEAPGAIAALLQPLRTRVKAG